MHSKMHWDASGESANQSAAWGEGRREGWVGFSTVQHCQTKMEIQYDMYKRRVQ